MVFVSIYCLVDVDAGRKKYEIGAIIAGSKSKRLDLDGKSRAFFMRKLVELSAR